MRLMAHLSGDPDLLRVFADGGDVFRKIAAALRGGGKRAADITDEERGQVRRGVGPVQPPSFSPHVNGVFILVLYPGCFLRRHSPWNGVYPTEGPYLWGSLSACVSRVLPVMRRCFRGEGTCFVGRCELVGHSFGINFGYAKPLPWEKRVFRFNRYSP